MQETHCARPRTPRRAIPAGCGNFDITLDCFSRISQPDPHPTLRTPCDVLHVSPMLIGCHGHWRLLPDILPMLRPNSRLQAYSCIEVVGDEVLVLWEDAPEPGDMNCVGTCRLVLSRRTVTAQSRTVAER